MKNYWVKCRKDTENIDPKWLEQKMETANWKCKFYL